MVDKYNDKSIEYAGHKDEPLRDETSFEILFLHQTKNLKILACLISIMGLSIFAFGIYLIPHHRDHVNNAPIDLVLMISGVSLAAIGVIIWIQQQLMGILENDVLDYMCPPQDQTVCAVYRFFQLLSMDPKLDESEIVKKNSLRSGQIPQASISRDLDVNKGIESIAPAQCSSITPSLIRVIV